MDSTFVCTYCGRLRPRSERVTVGADALCWSCSEEHTTLCDRCGAQMYRRQGFRTTAAHSVRRALNKSITIETA